MTALLFTYGLLAAVVLVILLTPIWKMNRRAALAAGGSILLLSLAFYAWIGAPGVISQVDQWREERARMEQDIADLSRQLEQDPKNIGLWVRLGRQFSILGEYGQAARAFKQAVILTEGDPRLILLYAKSLTMAADGTVTPDARQGFEMALKLEPENPEARYFLALAKDQSGDKTGARDDFKSLLNQLDSGDPLRDNVKNYLEQ